MEKICEVSNPEIVLKQLKKYYGGDVDLYLSCSKHKKYMIFNEEGKKVHFGSILYQQKNKQRRDNFRNRNRRWADAEKYTPAHLSYYLLW